MNAETAHAKEKESPAFRELREGEDLSTKEWLDSLAADGSIRVSIVRKRPMTGPNGENVSGLLETVDGKIDEDYVREQWGGGEFALKISTMNKTGAYQYFKSRTIKIAGAPKMSGQALGGGERVAVAAVAADDGMAERAFQSMENAALRERERAERLEDSLRKQGGIDVAALQALNAPLMEQLRVAQHTIAELQSQAMSLSSRPAPRDEFRDRLMERMIDGESGRLETLRAQYEARIDRLRDAHEEQIKRLEDRHTDDIRRLEQRHERDMKGSERIIDAQLKNQDVANAARLESMKSENARLERDLNAAMAKIGALEARKDQSISEKADELIKVREALEGLGGGDGEKDAAWYEKLIGAVGNSEAVIGLLNKVGGGAPQEQQPAPVQRRLPAPGIPFQGPDGKVYVRSPDGTVAMVDPAMVRQQRALVAARKQRKAAVAAPKATQETSVVDDALADTTVGKPQFAGRMPTQAEVKIATNFMESALQNETDPAQFAATVRNLMPGDILAYIRHAGIDAFMSEVARLEPGSPLTTQRGKNFIRGVEKHLLEGATE